ncbi:hypothetical protein AYI70_g158 [Smittium culicis]|uniref:Uncharacterized protein n=1 Tax=Smittium culicis TaxID=133412 RepID=A0A1R1YHQ0_9FUNG|nr:hypothetical protein AYI70_g158 [Smittium culicis]
MEQQAETQATMSQDQLKIMTDMVQQLFRERELTNLTVYPEIFEALPSIEEDFFKTSFTEEERKIEILSCSKASLMKCIPPPLIDSASSAVKKADSELYRIQLALAQATQPIDYYVHCRIQKTPGINTALDPEVTFARTMHALLTDIAYAVTQARLDNLHKSLNPHRKPKQLVESDTKLLMDQEALDALIFKKPAAKRQRLQPFRRRQKNTIPKDTYIGKNAISQKANATIASESSLSNRNADSQSIFRGKGSQ